MSKALVSFVLVLFLSLIAFPASSLANTSHKGWPKINGIFLINKKNQSRPLDMRVGADPFGGTTKNYSCDGIHKSQTCFIKFKACKQSKVHTYLCAAAPVVPPNNRHNELLGRHGNDVIHAGNGTAKQTGGKRGSGDVIWGDESPTGNTRNQRDQLFGGDGGDFIYASHGYNRIFAGAGNDYVKAHFIRPGASKSKNSASFIDCGPGKDTLYITPNGKKKIKIVNCEKISHSTLGY